MLYFFGAIAAFLQPISGDISAKNVAKYQPAKLAAMESLFETSKPAALIIGGIPNVEKQEVKYAIKIPALLSFMAHGDFKAEVIGLDRFEKKDWPPVRIVHFAFQFMVFFGILMLVAGIIYFIFRFKKTDIREKKWWLRTLVCLTPVGFLAVECGWIVTEVGRQPWIIYGIMKTKDALTPMPGIIYTFSLITLTYVLLSFVVFWLLQRQIKVLNESHENNHNTH